LEEGHEGRRLRRHERRRRRHAVLQPRPRRRAARYRRARVGTPGERDLPDRRQPRDPVSAARAGEGDGGMNEALDRLTATPFEARNFPEAPLSVDGIRARGYVLGDLWLPTLVARESALTHNLERFAAWCREREVRLAPHGKTSMAPQLWQRQLDAGAWGITAATVAQARVMDRYGVPHVIVANEVVDPEQALWLAGVNRADDRAYYVLVDSDAGFRVVEDAAERAGAEIPVLVEVGVTGGRTGAPTADEALALGRAVKESAHLRLAGVEGYEGALPQGRRPEAV